MALVETFTARSGHAPLCRQQDGKWEGVLISEMRVPGTGWESLGWLPISWSPRDSLDGDPRD